MSFLWAVSHLSSVADHYLALPFTEKREPAERGSSISSQNYLLPSSVPFSLPPSPAPEGEPRSYQRAAPLRPGSIPAHLPQQPASVLHPLFSLCCHVMLVSMQPTRQCFLSSKKNPLSAPQALQPPPHHPFPFSANSLTAVWSPHLTGHGRGKVMGFPAQIGAPLPGRRPSSATFYPGFLICTTGMILAFPS